MSVLSDPERIISQQQLDNVVKNIGDTTANEEKTKSPEAPNKDISSLLPDSLANLTPEMREQFLLMLKKTQQSNETATKSEGGKKRRRRSVSDELYREIRMKTDSERRLLEQSSNTKGTQQLHELFNDLQSMASTLGIPVETPELVVVGMQSDGKSSFIEALVGFQFNVVESTIGTRRPLILQMINRKECRTPVCRFVSEKGILEERDIPVEYLSREIASRTRDVAGSTNVSNKPLVLRVEYTGCSNLTIIDTPGFRIGGDESLKNDILAMVKELIQPPNRIIVCLEQSTTEWANSISRPIVKEVDPHFSRTVLINTKFDNRVKELTDSTSVDTYLNGDPLIIGEQKPFFISLPCKRNIGMEHFSDYIQDSYINDYRQLLEIGFDESRYKAQIGFHRAKSYLENLLQNKYKEFLAPTANKLASLVVSSKREIAQMESEMTHMDTSVLRKRSIHFIQLFAFTTKELLDGNINFNIINYGKTLSEDDPTLTNNTSTRLCGGAQIRRILGEYEKTLIGKVFPKPTSDEIDSSFGIESSEDKAAYVIASNAAVTEIKPLISNSVEGVCNILHQFFNVVIASINETPQHVLPQSDESNQIFSLNIADKLTVDNITNLIRYEGFIQVLKQGYDVFIEKLKFDCIKKLEDDFESSLHSITVDTCHTDSGDERVVKTAEYIFEKIRERLTNLVVSKIKAFLVQPLEKELLSWLLDGFLGLDVDKYESLFNFSEEAMRKRIEQLRQQAGVCEQNYLKFMSTLKEIDKVGSTVDGLEREC